MILFPIHSPGVSTAGLPVYAYHWFGRGGRQGEDVSQCFGVELFSLPHWIKVDMCFDFRRSCKSLFFFSIESNPPDVKHSHCVVPVICGFICENPVVSGGTFFIVTESRIARCAWCYRLPKRRGRKWKSRMGSSHLMSKKIWAWWLGTLYGTSNSGGWKST